MWDAIRFGVLIVLTGSATYWDCRWGKIPNWLTVPSAIVAFSLCLLPSSQPNYFSHAVLGMGLASGIMLLLYLSGGVGGGDVKFSIAFGLLAGYPNIILYLFYGSLAALAIILGRLAWYGEMQTGVKSACSGGFFKKRLAAAPNPEAEVKPKTSTGVSFALALLLAIIWVQVMTWF